MKTQNATPRKPLGLSSTHQNQWAGWAAMKAPRLDLGGIPRISRDLMNWWSNHEIMKSWNQTDLMISYMKSWNHENLMIWYMKSWKYLIWKLIFDMKITYETTYEIKLIWWFDIWNHEIWKPQFDDLIYEIIEIWWFDMKIWWFDIWNLMIKFW